MSLLSINALKGVETVVFNRSRELMEIYFRQLQESLLEGAANSMRVEAWELLVARKAFREKCDFLTRIFLEKIRRNFQLFKTGRLTDQVPDPDNGQPLALVEHGELDEDVAILAICQRADSIHMESLWSLCQRLSVLRPDHKVSAQTNPLAPIRFCKALRETLKKIDVGPQIKVMALNLFEQQFIVQLDGVYRAVNNELKTKGVLPNLRYEIVKSRGGSNIAFRRAQDHYNPVDGWLGGGEIHQAIRPLTPPDPGLSSVEYQRELLDGIRELRNSILGMNAGAARSPPTNYSATQLGDVLKNIQGQYSQQIRELPETPAVRGRGSAVSVEEISALVLERLGQALNLPGAASLRQQDMQTIDLVGMLFEYMLNDDELPDSVKILLSYLHTPYLKLAYADKEFFDSPEHPARVLLNRLGEAGAFWVSDDGSHRFGVYARIRDIVQQILNDDANDNRKFSRLLMEFQGFIKKIELRVRLMERRASEKAQGEDRLREVKYRVHNEITSRIGERKIPSAVLLLLLQPWSDYMGLVLLRDGPSSESWMQALDVIDDLLWGLELGDSEDERERWRQHCLWLESIIEKGLDFIGYDSDRARKLMTSINKIYELKLKGRDARPASEDIRNKLVSLAEKKIDLANRNVEPVGEKEAEIVAQLRMMEFGTWFEHSDGRREKVAWFNPKTLQFLFVDQSGKRTGMYTGKEVAKAMIAGEMRMIEGSTRPLIERTLEQIFMDLNKRTAVAGVGMQQS